MVDWKSPQEIARDYDAFSKFMHALLGLYFWEFVLSLGFDWQFISGKKTFRWPLIFYFAGRYVLLFALIGVAVALNVTTEINCQALYTFNEVMGNMSIGLASINLSLRTMAVWSQKWYIVVPLIAMIMGHWSLLLHGVLLKTEWAQGGCVIVMTSNKILAASFIYGMTFDLVVLCLTGIKLASPASGRSKLVSLIFGDGLIYFMVALFANALATAFMLANLNAVMSIIANVPAAIVANIAACRVVRRLYNYTTESVEMFASSQGSKSTVALRNRVRTALPVNANKTGTGVHVHMETFAAHEPRQQSFMDYDDVTDHKDPTYDAEAQAIADEFKRPCY